MRELCDLHDKYVKNSHIKNLRDNVVDSYISWSFTDTLRKLISFVQVYQE